MKDPFGSSLLISSSNLAVQPLQRVFHKTTASYKFLWFLAILDLVREAGQVVGPIRLSIAKICTRMVAKSWIPTERFKLSFGRWDQIMTIIEALKNPENEFPFDSRYKEAEALRALEGFSCAKPEKFKKIIFSPLARYVPYRFLSVWFPRAVDSFKEAVAFNSKKNPYYFPENSLSSIEISAEWRKYFLENYALLKDFTYWNFADFLQTRNTAVPGLVKKFELPESRISLETQRKFWAPFLTSSHLAKDIFGNQLDPNNFALDHFLPWTFVVHNQIWNLTPMDRSLNSSKSDQIPRDSYIRPLALQHKNLVRYHFSKDRKRSEDFFTEYENFLGIEIADFLSASDAQVIELYQEHLDPLQQTALNMGFPLWQ